MPAEKQSSVGLSIGQLRRQISLGTEAVYRVSDVKATSVQVEVVRAPGLESGFRFALTPAALLSMDVVDAHAPIAPVGLGEMDRDTVQRSIVDYVPPSVRSALRPAIAPVARHMPGRMLRWGSLRRLRPFSNHYGWERGEPVDRRYIDAFLARNRDSIAGEVLEVRAAHYSRRYGSRVTRTHIVDIDRGNSDATLIADLTSADSLPSDSYDCAIVTQTIQFLSDVDTAIANLRQSLRPGGSLLITVPCLGKIDHEAPDSDYWRWTPAGLRLLLERTCPGDRIRVEGYGNLLTSVAFLFGLAQQELLERELDYGDSTFPLIACARVDRAG